MQNKVKQIRFSILVKIAVIMAVFFSVLVLITAQISVKSSKYVLEGQAKVICYILEVITNVIIEQNKLSLDNIDKEQLANTLGTLYKETCYRLDVESMYLVRLTEGSDKGYCLLYVTPDSIKVTDDTTVDGGYYTLTDEEIQIANGEVQNSENSYESKGHICRAFYMKCSLDDYDDIMLGFNINPKLLFRLRSNIIMAVYGLLLLAFILSVIIIFYVIKELIINRINEISNAMHNFVTNETLNYEPLQVKGSDELSQMADAYNKMAGDIKAYVDNIKRSNAELKIASDIQQGLLPPNYFENEYVRLEGYMKAARNVGGDFFFYHELEDCKIIFAIGDVSGKGISASLLMANVNSAIKYNALMYNNPAEILRHVNNDIVVNNAENLFVTIFVGIYDPSTSVLTYSNAGHNPPYLLSKNGIKPIAAADGVIAGLFEDETYENSSIELEYGDRILLYTDGINEAVNNKKEFLGIKRLENALAKIGNENLITEVLRVYNSFIEDAEQSDDVTLLSFEIKTDKVIEVEADVSNISKLKSFILNDIRLAKAFRNKIFLVIEEIFVNICSYGYAKGVTGHVKITLRVDSRIVRLFIVDDARAYNPLEQMIDIADYDIEKKAGGLGKHIAFTVMDDAFYEYKDGKNILDMRKAVGGKK